MIESPHKLKVVIADDEPEMLEYVSHLVTRAGHFVAGTAADGRQLIELHRQHLPDLIITDMHMPEVDGLEAAGRCFAECPVAIIVVSAHHNRDLIQRAADNHVLVYLVKPIKAKDLERAIAIAMDRFQEFQSLDQQAESLEQTVEGGNEGNDSRPDNLDDRQR